MRLAAGRSSRQCLWASRATARTNSQRAPIEGADGHRLQCAAGERGWKPAVASCFHFWAACAALSLRDGRFRETTTAAKASQRSGGGALMKYTFSTLDLGFLVSLSSAVPEGDLVVAQHFPTSLARSICPVVHFVSAARAQESVRRNPRRWAAGGAPRSPQIRIVCALPWGFASGHSWKTTRYP